ncbi:TPA_asm: dUTPase [Anelosimus tangle-web spider MELD virus]|nr:TPA_asm: dUTPase [Anelosimus tangle-web spider MELD virus]
MSLTNLDPVTSKKVLDKMLESDLEDISSSSSGSFIPDLSQDPPEKIKSLESSENDHKPHVSLWFDNQFKRVCEAEISNEGLDEEEFKLFETVHSFLRNRFQMIEQDELFGTWNGYETEIWNDIRSAMYTYLALEDVQRTRLGGEKVIKRKQALKNKRKYYPTCYYEKTNPLVKVTTKTCSNQSDKSEIELGYTIRLPFSVFIAPAATVQIDLNMIVDIPEAHIGEIRFVKDCYELPLKIIPKLISPGYTGMVNVTVYNFSSSMFVLEANKEYFQLVVNKPLMKKARQTDYGLLSCPTR